MRQDKDQREVVVLVKIMLSKEEKKKMEKVVLYCDSFQLEALDVRCDGGLEGPEGRLLEVFAGILLLENSFQFICLSV